MLVVLQTMIRTRQACSTIFFSQCFNEYLPPLTSDDRLGFTIADQCPEDVLCSQKEVTHLLESIDISKSDGPDKISGKMLKATALSITLSITKPSIKLGLVPQMWKMSKVVPIPKIHGTAATYI